MKILVILVCGDLSVHESWGLEGRQYDLWMHYYGDKPGRYKDQVDYYEEGKGFKWPILHRIAESKEAEIAKYDYIICPDDDIAWTSAQFMEAGQLMAKHFIDIGQPSITGRGTHYEELKQKWTQSAWTPKAPSDGRLVNFIEVMTPIFHRFSWAHLSWTFKEASSGWGIDSIWAYEMAERRMAVWDKIPVEHKRPQETGEIYAALKAAGKDARLEQARIHLKYPCVTCTTLGEIG